MGLLQRFEDAGHDGRDVRPLTFWSWNDRLEPEELRRQIREMAKGGLGGHFMHSRRGLATPYLGPEWMEAVRACVDEARHTEIVPWLYDEDCWPSGTCSGRVYAGRDVFQQKHLVYEEVDGVDWEPAEHSVAVFAARPTGKDEYRDFRRIENLRAVAGAELADGEVLVHFVYRFHEYVDVLSREATEEFLKRTHDLYRDSIGREFGQVVPGIFTDEPMYGRGGHRVPWSLELPRFFQRSCGYDVLDHLPELFFSVGPYRKTRFDFYESLTRLFLLAWTLPVSQWCERHGLLMTGHMMAEDTLRSQVEHIGAAMPHYEYFHAPGIDHLGRCLGSPVLVKQASSVAAQFDRARVLSEMFGCSGWNVSFDDLRWIAEWQFVLGVNCVCQHLSSYTLRGVRKRDYPPSLHYHQPWWPHYFLLNDYVARLLTMLTSGQAVADVLVIHPIASAWAEFSPLDHSAVDALDARLLAVVRQVLASHADFHFGDELILERHARVSRGQVVVGSRRYRLVIVPDATNLRKSTVALLKRLKRSGGKIVFAERVPECVDGDPSKAVEALAKRCIRADALTPRGRAALRRALAPKLEVLTPGGKDADTILSQWRTAGREHVFFFLNTDSERSVRTRVRLPVAGVPLRLDPNTGQAHEVKAVRRGGRATVSHTFGPRESLLLLASPATRKGAAPTPGPAPRRRKVLRGRWRLWRQDPNALTLDTAAWRTDEGEYSEPMPVMDIQEEFLRTGMQEVVVLRYEFDCAIRDLKGRRFELVLEQPEAYEMWFGGMRTPMADAGPYWDSALRRIDVTPFVRTGTNVIELRRPWRIGEGKRRVLLGLDSGWASRTGAPDVELESVYLVGDFSVTFPAGSKRGPNGSRWMRGRPRLVPEPAGVSGTDLVRAGYPFYVGRMTLEKDIVIDGQPSDRALVALAGFDAVTATVRVNGEEAGTVWKPPREVAVGHLLVRGKNRVSVTLTTSLRNLLGPHHHPDGELHWVAPGSFACRKGWMGRGGSASRYVADYNLVDFGLGGVEIRY